MKRTCPQCRNPVAVSATKCPICGARLRRPNTISESLVPEPKRGVMPRCVVVLGIATSLYGVLASLLFLVLAVRTAKSLPQLWQAEIVLPFVMFLLGAALLAAGVGLLQGKKWSLQVISAGTLGTVIIAGVGLLKTILLGPPAVGAAWVPLALGAALWMILVAVSFKLPAVQKSLEEF